MAGYTCMFGEAEHEATWIQTSLTTGTTLAWCDDDAPTAAIGYLSALLGLDAGQLHKAIEREQARQVKAAEREAAKPEAVHRRQAEASAAAARADQAEQLAQLDSQPVQ